jgi:hypothetical protein
MFPYRVWHCFFQDNPQPSASLLAIAVGIKQKEIVDRIVTKVAANLDILLVFKYLVHICT